MGVLANRLGTNHFMLECLRTVGSSYLSMLLKSTWMEATSTHLKRTKVRLACTTNMSSSLPVQLQRLQSRQSKLPILKSVALEPAWERHQLDGSPSSTTSRKDPQRSITACNPKYSRVSQLLPG